MFFSGRRRHTRWPRDWSSDVCSSDLKKIIDTLHIPFIGKRRKPRTYRKKARKQYLSLSKQRKPSKEKIHKAIKQQLGYVHRNLKHIEKLGINSIHTLSNKVYRDLLVIQEFYIKQSILFKI